MDAARTSTSPGFTIRRNVRERLGYAGTVLGFERSVVDALFSSLTDSWLSDYESVGEEANRHSSWRCDISDDGCPVELSAALGGQSELRFLVEAQARSMDALTAFDAGKALNESLLKFPGVNLERFGLVEDLFAPRPGGDVRFSLWHAAVARRSGEIAFKAYLNPAISGTSDAWPITLEALARLGLSQAADEMSRLIAAGGAHLQCLYFSLDLDGRQGSRVKIYVAHQHATLSSIEEDLAFLPSAAVWDARQALRILAGQGPFSERPILSCFGFSEGKALPQHTLHVPVRCYTPNDAESLARLEQLAPQALYNAARQLARATSVAPLEETRGHISYISTKRDDRDARVTLYLSATPSAALLPSYLNEHVPPAATASDVPSGGVTSETRIKIGSASEKLLAELLEELEAEIKALSLHRLARLLERSNTKEDVAVILRALAFFDVGYRDIVRVCAEKVRDPRLSTFVTEQYRQVMTAMAHPNTTPCASPDMSLREVFDDQHRNTRDSTYRLLRACSEPKSDVARFIIVVALSRARDDLCARLCTARPDTSRQPGPEQPITNPISSDLLSARFKPGELEESREALATVFSVFRTLTDDAAARVETDRQRR